MRKSLSSIGLKNQALGRDDLRSFLRHSIGGGTLVDDGVLDDYLARYRNTVPLLNPEILRKSSEPDSGSAEQKESADLRNGEMRKSSGSIFTQETAESEGDLTPKTRAHPCIRLSPSPLRRLQFIGGFPGVLKPPLQWWILESPQRPPPHLPHRNRKTSKIPHVRE
jgi:hypothetical protein